MNKYKVFYEQRDLRYAIVKADSAEEAEELADINFNEYDWHYTTINSSGEILYGDTQEQTDE